MKIKEIFVFPFFFNFHPTLTANNSGLKPSKLKNYHIFGMLRTSAFSWFTPFRSYYWSTLREMRFCLSNRYTKIWQKGENRGAERDSKNLSRARSRCFKGEQDPLGQDQLKNHVYLLRFGHTKALLFKKKWRETAIFPALQKLIHMCIFQQSAAQKRKLSAI